MSDFDIGELRLTVGNVELRDDEGRFLAHNAEAAHAAAKEAAEHGASVAKRLAPSKTGYMATTIHAEDSTTSQFAHTLTAVFDIRVGTDYWKYTNYGTRSDVRSADVSFFWENRDRYFRRGPNEIHHPGIHAHHFMDYGFEAAADELPYAVERHF